MKLEILVSGQPKSIFETESPVVTIGRSRKSNECAIPAEDISRTHCQIRYENGRYFIKDLNSQNGTYLSEERLQPGVENEFMVVFPIRLGSSTTINVALEDASRPRIPIAKMMAQSDVNTTTRTVNIPKKTVVDSGKKKGKGKLAAKKQPKLNYLLVLGVVVAAIVVFLLLQEY